MERKGVAEANESYHGGRVYLVILLCPVPIYQINGFVWSREGERKGTHVCVQRGRRLRDTEFDTECRSPINRVHWPRRPYRVHSPDARLYSRRSSEPAAFSST